MEMFGYSREMTSHVMQVVGQMQAHAQAQQDQAQDQLNQVMAQAEAQRADAKQRKEAQRVEAQAQRAEAMNREELALAREQMLARMKAETKEASQKREESIRSENLAREELLIRMKTDADRTNAERERVVAENEFKRQKMFVDTNAAIQREKMQADLPKDIEFQQSHRKERYRAIAAQQKLRELAAQELKERVHLERELVKQQQQNLILQKQREIDRLGAQADRNLFQQGQASSDGPAPKEKLATVQEEPATRSPEAAVVLTDSDTPPPSQYRPKRVRRPPIMIDVGIQECLVPVSEPLVVSTVSVSEGPMLDLATGVPLPTSHGPLVIPGGPVAAATPSHWLTRMWVKPCILRMPSPWVH